MHLPLGCITQSTNAVPFTDLFSWLHVAHSSSRCVATPQTLNIYEVAGSVGFEPPTTYALCNNAGSSS